MDKLSQIDLKVLMLLLEQQPIYKYKKKQKLKDNETQFCWPMMPTYATIEQL